MTDQSWEHQAREYRLYRSTRARAMFWSMRTGKTKAVIDKACFQFSKGNIRGLIVMAPNGVHVNWTLNETPKWTWPELGPPAALAWEMPKRGDPKFAAAFEALCNYKGFKVFSLNMESVRFTDTIRAIRQFIDSCGGEFMLVLSEAHHFGKAGAKRTRTARRLAKAAKFVTLESGTPILNSPLRAYAMFKVLLEDGLVPESEIAKGKARKARGLDAYLYEDFVQYFSEIVVEKQKARSVRRRAYKKIKDYRRLDELRTLMAPHASVVLRSDVKDMPPLLDVERTIIMSDLQRTAYMEMVSKHLLEINTAEKNGESIKAMDAGARMIKLQQIINGYIKDTETGKIIDIDPHAPIYEALVEQVSGTLPGKTIVWCRFREDIARCVQRLKRSGFGVLEFHGGIPNSKREPIRKAFIDNPKYSVLVGQPAAGGEGRDFSAADTIVFFSSTPNAIHVEQAKERGTKKGGHTVTIVRFRTRGTVDDRNWELADGKVRLADTVSGQGLKALLLATDI